MQFNICRLDLLPERHFPQIYPVFQIEINDGFTRDDLSKAVKNAAAVLIKRNVWVRAMNFPTPLGELIIIESEPTEPCGEFIAHLPSLFSAEARKHLPSIVSRMIRLCWHRRFLSVEEQRCAQLPLARLPSPSSYRE